MLEVMKKVVLIGVGAAAMTKDKVQELAKELAEKAKMSEKEGQEFLDDVSKKWDEGVKPFESRVEKAVKAALGKLDIATKPDLEKLSARIKHLEQLLEEKRTDADS